MNQSFPNLIKEMKMDPFTLRFYNSREEKFIAFYNRESIPFMRIGLIIGILMYSSFGILDSYLIENITLNYYIIRYAIVLPFGILTLILTFFRNLQQYMQLLVSYVVTLSGAGLVALVLISQPPISYMYYAGLLLVIMANYNLLRIRYINAMISGWVIVLLYVLAARFIAITPKDIFISNTSFLVGTNLIGICTGYYFEFAFRRDFYLAEELEKERQKTDMANRSLERKVHDRTEQLIESNEALKVEIEQRIKEEHKRRKTEEKLHHLQKMESIGTLSGGIAHDFNNILGTILGYTDILNRQKAFNETSQSYITQIANASLRAKGLVEQLLTFSRHMKPKLVKGSMHPIVADAISSLKPLLPQNISLVEEIDTMCGNVMVDANQMHQVILNLCNNALHAMNGNGGTLTIILAQVYQGETNYVSLTISDTGTGMDKEVVKRIFEPYFTTKPVNEGHGLGLAMVHGIIKNHNGEINVLSEAGKGSSFEILLPRES
ncbi:MAG: hypothetical protein GVY19_04385 [Bacteroidetes bacterium]|jgi:signal transduction histidine kinase|nr:hypothetical protein [Bacteroidota bacterium]